MVHGSLNAESECCARRENTKSSAAWIKNASDEIDNVLIQPKLTEFRSDVQPTGETKENLHPLKVMIERRSLALQSALQCPIRSMWSF